MQLRDWLERQGLSYTQFGSAISRSAEAVRRYANGERVPDRQTMQKIVQQTGGQVMPNDFYEVGHGYNRIRSALPKSPDGAAENIGAAA